MGPPHHQEGSCGPCLISPATPWPRLLRFGRASRSQGLGKRVGVRQFSKTRRGALGVRGLRLRDGDSLAYMSVVGVNAPCEPSESCGDVVVASREGLVQRNAIANISLQSRSSRGVAVMRLQVAPSPVGCIAWRARSHDRPPGASLPSLCAGT